MSTTSSSGQREHKPPSTIYAAGTVCWRESNGRVEVLLIHRNRYDDVSLPKGKVDPGETLPQTAVRETYEETGLRIVLGIPVGKNEYTLPGGEYKIVQYWAAEVTAPSEGFPEFVPNEEVASISWVPLSEACASLSYDLDKDILRNFDSLLNRGVLRTFALISLRHAEAVAASEWDGMDGERSLTSHGRYQAETVVSTIMAWKPHTLISSTARRCKNTIEPLSQATGLPVTFTNDLSEAAYEHGTANIDTVLENQIRARTTTVLCSHSPVLEEIFRTIVNTVGIMDGSHSPGATLPPLRTASFRVFHLSIEDPSRGIISWETHGPYGTE